jgi:hypothetical protein
MALPAQRDVQTRALDLSQLRIVRVGAPDPADTEDAPRLRDVDKIEFCDREFGVDFIGVGPRVVAEFTIDFSRMTCAMIDGQIAAGLAVIGGGGVGELSLWVGAPAYSGFSAAPAGVKVAAAFAAAAALAPVSGVGAAFAKPVAAPGAATIVQVAIGGSGVLTDVAVTAIHGSFKGV